MPLTINRSIAALLKEKTYAHHVQTEKLLVPILKSISSEADYLTVLSLFYSFYSALEPRVFNLLSENDIADLSERKKLPLLKKDISSLKGKVTDIAPCTEFPEINTTNKAFGALYVMEGSTLGGKIIANIITKNAGNVISPRSLNFFNSYGESTASKWKLFLEALDSRQDDPEEIVDSAIETFNCMQAHFTNNF